MANVSRSATAKVQSLTVGQTILFGSSVVAASLGGFYWNLRRMQRKKQEKGDLPHCTSLLPDLSISVLLKYGRICPDEYLLAHVASRGLANPVPGAAELPLSRMRPSGNVIPPPVKDHRAKAAVNSMAYTKSPDYAKSYEKTRTKKAGMPSLEITEVPEVLGASPS
ncbi:hypothetical protein H0H87_012632 [Tephrocybe sp. NHM501043]|nr:hypothetical protein H0H87_012632 [Tephrocybe sp. NHM501043]